MVASPEDIQGLIGRMSRLDDAVAAAIEQGEEELAEVTEIRESADDAPVIKLVNSIIAQAVEEGASDIHFEPEGREMRVRFRVDGVLRETTQIPRRMVAGVVSRVKIMADLDIAEKRVPQDGRVSLTVERPRHRHPRRDDAARGRRGHRDAHPGQVAGADRPRSAGHVGGQRGASSRTRFRRSYGAVLVTGPTGSGKSTTLYARAQRDQRARAQHHHDRGPGRVPARRA